jgi:N utilization substance protein B
MSEADRKGFSKIGRVRARRSVVQALYQWSMDDKSMSDVICEFEKDRTELNKADIEYFRELLNGVSKHIDELEHHLSPLLDRPLSEIDPVEKAILQLGIYELIYHLELPWRVVLNESIELAKMFGADQSYKYVNGILDKAAHQIRTLELSGTAS